MKLETLRDAWDEAGRDDPLWSVLSHTGKRGNRWDLEEFLQTGVAEIDGIMAYIAGLGLQRPKRRALDFGCGPGRLSQALARHVGQVDGVDISPSMIELANRLNQFPDRCRYHLNVDDDLKIFEDQSFDFVYSNITLQHMEPVYARRYLQEFARVLSPDGVLIFQIPARQVGLRPRLRAVIPRPLLRAYRRLRHGEHPATQMHGMLKRDVLAFCEGLGLSVVDVQADPEVGRGWESFRYCCRRRT
jgi:SAM-dependent methyltransferase